VVQNNVKPEYLEADRILLIIRLSRPVGMLQRWVHRDDRFRQAILNVGPELVNVKPRLVLSNVLPNGGHRPFVAAGVIIHVLIKDKVVRVLLDGVVGQVHKEVVEVAVLRSNVLLSRETGEPLLVNEYPQGVNTVDQDIYSEVELQAIDQVGLMEVSLSDVLISLLKVHVLNASDEENPLALAKIDRLHDECLVVLLFVELRPEVVHLLGQNPSLRKEVVVGWENFVHSHKVSTQIVLPGELIHSWVVINSLVRHEFGNLLRRSSIGVVPVDVPIAGFVVEHLVPQLSECLLDNYVSALCGAEI
jgi:hypothetical protein